MKKNKYIEEWDFTQKVLDFTLYVKKKRRYTNSIKVISDDQPTHLQRFQLPSTGATLLNSQRCKGHVGLLPRALHLDSWTRYPHVILPSHLLLGPAVRAQVVWEIAKRCGNASATVFNFFWGREPRLTYPQGHTVHLGVKKHAELYLKFEPYRYDFVGTKRLYYNPYKEKKCFLIRTVVVKSM